MSVSYKLFFFHLICISLCLNYCVHMYVRNAIWVTDKKEVRSSKKKHSVWYRSCMWMMAPCRSNLYCHWVAILL